MCPRVAVGTVTTITAGLIHTRGAINAGVTVTFIDIWKNICDDKSWLCNSYVIEDSIERSCPFTYITMYPWPKCFTMHPCHICFTMPSGYIFTMYTWPTLSQCLLAIMFTMHPWSSFTCYTIHPRLTWFIMHPWINWFIMYPWRNCFTMHSWPTFGNVPLA